MNKFRIEFKDGATRTASVKIAPTLKKFMVHFRRPTGYQGKYGFDWLRDEYIYPIESVAIETPPSSGNFTRSKKALCKNVASLKTEYKKDVLNPISPYGNDYYPAWLSIFPHTTTAQFKHGSRMHKDGVSLDLEIEALESLVKDSTELLFECADKNVIITPNKLNLKNLIGNKKTKNLGGTTTRDYYLATKKINIKNTTTPLKKHEEIKVFAKLGTQKKEVGKLMIYKNNRIPKAEVVVINVNYASSIASLRDDYQYLFKKQSFNQALIRMDVATDTKFNLDETIRKYPTDPDVISLKNNFIAPSQVDANTKDIQFHKDIIKLYEKYGKHSPGIGMIDGNQQKTYLFYTNILASSSGFSTLGICSLDTTTGAWGNSYIIYSTGLSSKHTVTHEAGHSFSLEHSFQPGATKYEFYQGTTDNIMDYSQQDDATAGFYHEDKMNCYFKWQWDIMRTDRSLINTY